MPVTFNTLQIGTTYERPYLAQVWGYKDFHAIAKGAVTPKETPFIILFITREKQDFQTQYEDHLENGVLEIEGETNHMADARMINASNIGDQIHLFYRDRHHMQFTYYGQIHLMRYERHTDSPSRFTFRVPSEHPDESLETELITHGQPNEEFIPDAEGRRVLRQHVSYERSPKNRQRALEIHGNTCMACGFNFDELYGLEHARGFIEIHHVKSITNSEGVLVDPARDLVPLCSNCHSMAHREKKRILTVEEIKMLLKERG
jgi:HNH endonuclease